MEVVDVLLGGVVRQVELAQGGVVAEDLHPQAGVALALGVPPPASKDSTQLNSEFSAGSSKAASALGSSTLPASGSTVVRRVLRSLSRTSKVTDSVPASTRG